MDRENRKKPRAANHRTARLAFVAPWVVVAPLALGGCQGAFAQAAGGADGSIDDANVDDVVVIVRVDASAGDGASGGADAAVVDAAGTDGTTGDAVAESAAGDASSVPDTGACEGSACEPGCSTDAQCAAPKPYCNVGACQATAPLGHPCSGNAQCATNNCVDGVCCSQASCPATDPCHVAGTCSSTNGQCSASPPAPNTTACTASNANTALCDGAGNCLAVSCLSGFDNDDGVCKSPSCVGVTCGGSDGAGGLCTGADGTCTSGLHCSAGGKCVCDGTSCAGCCNASGQCETSSAGTCGTGGAACQACGDCCTVSGQCGQTWAPDADGDSFGDANAVTTGMTVCSVSQPLSGYVSNHLDCCDKDGRAHPMQAAPASPEEYPGLTEDGDGGVSGPQMPDNCGSFDYDCSGEAVPLYTNLCTAANYACPATCPLGTSGAIRLAGTCALCDISTPLPASCPVGAPMGTGYSSAQPACGTAVGLLSLLCEGSSTTCSLGSTIDPPAVDQLCF